MRTLSKRFTDCLALCLVFGCLAATRAALAQVTPAAGSAPIPAEVGDLVNKNAKLFLAWSRNELTTPGVTAEAKEVGRKTAGGNLMVQYHVYLKGVSRDQSLTALNWPINSPAPVTVMEGLTVSSEGMVICAGREPWQCSSPERKDDPVELTFLPAKGEPYRIAFISDDKSTKALFVIIPDPIKNADKGCSLEVVRLLPKFELAVIRATGFQPNEDLAFASKSYDEARESKAKTDANGNYTMVLLPAVQGKTKGKTKIALTGAQCSPSLTFEWGN